MSKPILCLDFDGVIHAYTSGWQGMSIIADPPVPGAIEFIERALEHFTVAIYSSRSRSFRGRRAMKRWLEERVEEYHGGADTYTDDFLLMIKWPWFKPSAFVTIDDRAIPFNGTFPTIESLRFFRPWYY